MSVVVVALLGAGAVVVAAPAAHAATVVAACSIAGAPTLAVGDTVTFNGKTCPGASDTFQAFALVSLTAGSVITLDAATSGTAIPAWGLRPESTTDFNVSTTPSFCRGSWSDKFEFTCRVPSTGVWRLRLAWNFSSDPASSITVASVVAAPVVAGQVPGGCSVSAATVAPAWVLQYSDMYCSQPGSTVNRHWKTYLYKGDAVSFRLSRNPPSDSAGAPGFWLLPVGTTDFTESQVTAWCAYGYVGTPVTLTCPTITRTGWYVETAEASLMFTPQVTHSVLNTVTRPASVKAKSGYVIKDKVTSIAGVPAVTCQVQMRVGRGWKTLKAVRAVKGVCTATVSFSTRGVKILRVWEIGQRGWASKLLPAFPVKVV